MVLVLARDDRKEWEFGYIEEKLFSPQDVMDSLPTREFRRGIQYITSVYFYSAIFPDAYTHNPKKMIDYLIRIIKYPRDIWDIIVLTHF